MSHSPGAALVLQAARQLLIEEGQEAVTPTRIASLTGISRTTIYRRWNDTADIIFEATATDIQESPPSPSGDRRTDLIDYLHGNADMLASPRGTLLATQIERTEHHDTVADIMETIAAERAPFIQRLAQHTGTDFSVAHALLVGPLVFQRCMARQPITDALIENTVDAYLNHYDPKPQTGDD
jgi:AcrR family transcriptional regulator